VCYSLLLIQVAEVCAPWNFRKPLRRETEATPLATILIMLWYISLAFLALWIIEKFLLHKGGFIHTLLLGAIGCFAVKFIQWQRTREYERSLRR